MNAPDGFFQGTEMPTAGWWPMLWPDPASVLATMGIERGLDVIDLCCGDGWFTAPLATIAGHVVAIDLDPKFLDMAQVRVSATGATIGTVWIGFAGPDRAPEARMFKMPGGRDRVRGFATHAALDYVRRRLLSLD